MAKQDLSPQAGGAMPDFVREWITERLRWERFLTAALARTVAPTVASGEDPEAQAA